MPPAGPTAIPFDTMARCAALLDDVRAQQWPLLDHVVVQRSGRAHRPRHGERGELDRPGVGFGASSRPTSTGASGLIVGSSGRRTTPFLKCRQAVAEAYPWEVVTEPRVMGRWERFRIIEAAGGDIDKPDGVGMLVGKGSSAGSTKRTPYRRGRMKLARMAAKPFELRRRERHPRDYRRRRHSATSPTMANHAVRRFAPCAIANFLATATALDNRDRHGDLLCAPDVCA